MHISNTAADLATQVSAARSAGKRIALVPTMGALHAGHISLISAARKHADFVVVSIFVNPLQFGAGEDFDRYPRTFEADAEALAAVEVDVLFAPPVDEIYPEEAGGVNAKPTKSAGPVGLVLEGAARPGHFDGMLTVVARLFDLAKPDFAVFGQKDAQQLFLIRRMARADYPALQIVAAPTVREPGGLAMSSRNTYLSEAQHKTAEIIHQGLRAAHNSASSPAAAIQAAQDQWLQFEAGQTLSSEQPEAKLDYVSLVDAETFEPVTESFHGRALMLVAVLVGKTRLIDNIEITF